MTVMLNNLACKVADNFGWALIVLKGGFDYENNKLHSKRMLY